MMETTSTANVHVGDAVYSADDHKIGSVKAYDPNFLTVEHGKLLKSEYYIPVSAVNAQATGAVYLTVTKDDVANRGWDTPPLLDTDAGNPPISHA